MLTAKEIKELKNYKWDTSTWVYISTGVRRNVKTGRLVYGESKTAKYQSHS